jgi:hypothetical protein
MSTFSTKGVDTTERSPVSRYLNYGINLAKINSITVEKAKTTDSKKVVFFLEGAPINDPTFQGIDGAKGCIGKMKSNFMNSDKSYKDLLRQIGIIADKAGVRPQIDAIVDTTIEGYIEQASKFITGKYLWWNIGAEEWEEGKTSLHLNKYEFVKSLSEIDEKTLKYDGYICTEARNPAGMIVLRFDYKNKFQFTPFVRSTPSFVLPGAASFPSTEETEDLPFDYTGPQLPF